MVGDYTYKVSFVTNEPAIDTTKPFDPMSLSNATMTHVDAYLRAYGFELVQWSHVCGGVGDLISKESRYHGFTQGASTRVDVTSINDHVKDFRIEQDYSQSNYDSYGHTLASYIGVDHSSKPGKTVTAVLPNPSSVTVEQVLAHASKNKPKKPKDEPEPKRDRSKRVIEFDE